MWNVGNPRLLANSTITAHGRAICHFISRWINLYRLLRCKSAALAAVTQPSSERLSNPFLKILSYICSLDLGSVFKPSLRQTIKMCQDQFSMQIGCVNGAKIYPHGLQQLEAQFHSHVLVKIDLA